MTFYEAIEELNQVLMAAELLFAEKKLHTQATYDSPDGVSLRYLRVSGVWMFQILRGTDWVGIDTMRVSERVKLARGIPALYDEVLKQRDAEAEQVLQAAAALAAFVQKKYTE